MELIKTMLKAALIGIGFMGRGHLQRYEKLNAKGIPVKLTTVCDIDKMKFEDFDIKGNLDMGGTGFDFSQYDIYYDIDNMLDNCDADYIDICLPTDLHAEAAIKAMEKGFHVLCEKPMALSIEDCQDMIDTSKSTGKKLMIAHCLRFWSEYNTLKEYVDNGKFGGMLAAYFYRMGGTPKWSDKDWMRQRHRSGTVVFDLHIHDTDIINHIFGQPLAMSSIGTIREENLGYESISSNFIYPGKVTINAQASWGIEGNFPFRMNFIVNFEDGNLIYENNVLTINTNEGESSVPEFDDMDGYDNEIAYFVDCIINDKQPLICTPESVQTSVEIALSQLESADSQGDKVYL